jgi:hypothetical protein
MVKRGNKIMLLYACPPLIENAKAGTVSEGAEWVKESNVRVFLLFLLFTVLMSCASCMIRMCGEGGGGGGRGPV